MGNKYKKFAAARADMLPIKVQILNYFTNFKDKSTDRMPNVVVDLPDLRIPKYFSHSVTGKFLDPFQNRASARSVCHETVSHEVLLYSKISKMTNFGTGHLQKTSFSSYY